MNDSKNSDQNSDKPSMIFCLVLVRGGRVAFCHSVGSNYNSLTSETRVLTRLWGVKKTLFFFAS